MGGLSGKLQQLTKLRRRGLGMPRTLDKLCKRKPPFRRHESMSTSQESGLSQTSTKALTHFPGLVHNQPDVLPEALKILRGISELTASVDAALTPFFEEVVAVLNSVEKNLAAAPEVPGHEALLVEWFGYGPLWARLVTRLIHRRGELLADEINEGRRVRAIIDQIAKAKGRNALVTSRRAERFRDECNSLEARDLIDEASQKAGLMTTAAEFNQLAEGACARDEAACLDLGQMAEQLAPHLPEKRGRPISPETCIHIFLQRHLESLGIKRAYTYSETDSNDDFVD